MRASGIHRNRRSFSGTKALDALGESLTAIRKGDDLTWTDVGNVLGKQRETVAGYGAGEGDMGVISFLLGCREWNGRFANQVMALIGMKVVPLDGGHLPDAACVLAILRAVVMLQEELAVDGDLSDADLRRHRDLIEAAGQVFDGYRARLASTE